MSETLSLLKDRIIKTDAVFDILVSKNALNLHLQDKLKLLNQRYFEKSAEVNDLQNKVELYKSRCLEYDTLKLQISELTAKVSNLENKYDSLLIMSESKYQDVNQKLVSCTNSCDHLRKKSCDLEKKLAESKKGFEELRIENELLVKENERLTSECRAAEMCAAEKVKLNVENDKLDIKCNCNLDKVKQNQSKEIDILYQRIQTLTTENVQLKNDLKLRNDFTGLGKLNLSIKTNMNREFTELNCDGASTTETNIVTGEAINTEDLMCYTETSFSALLKEMMEIPKPLSPLSADLDCYSEPEADFDVPEESNCSTLLPTITVTPPTPTAVIDGSFPVPIQVKIYMSDHHVPQSPSEIANRKFASDRDDRTLSYKPKEIETVERKVKLKRVYSSPPKEMCPADADLDEDNLQYTDLHLSEQANDKSPSTRSPEVLLSLPNFDDLTKELDSSVKCIKDATCGDLPRTELGQIERDRIRKKSNLPAVSDNELSYRNSQEIESTPTDSKDGTSELTNIHAGNLQNMPALDFVNITTDSTIQQPVTNNNELLELSQVETCTQTESDAMSDESIQKTNILDGICNSGPTKIQNELLLIDQPDTKTVTIHSTTLTRTDLQAVNSKHPENDDITEESHLVAVDKSHAQQEVSKTQLDTPESHSTVAHLSDAVADSNVSVVTDKPSSHENLNENELDVHEGTNFSVIEKQSTHKNLYEIEPDMQKHESSHTDNDTAVKDSKLLVDTENNSIENELADNLPLLIVSQSLNQHLHEIVENKISEVEENCKFNMSDVGPANDCKLSLLTDSESLQNELGVNTTNVNLQCVNDKTKALHVVTVNQSSNKHLRENDLHNKATNNKVNVPDTDPEVIKTHQSTDKLSQESGGTSADLCSCEFSDESFAIESKSLRTKSKCSSTDRALENVRLRKCIEHKKVLGKKNVIKLDEKILEDLCDTYFNRVSKLLSENSDGLQLKLGNKRNLSSQFKRNKMLLRMRTQKAREMYAFSTDTDSDIAKRALVRAKKARSKLKLKSKALEGSVTVSDTCSTQNTAYSDDSTSVFSDVDLGGVNANERMSVQSEEAQFSRFSNDIVCVSFCDKESAENCGPVHIGEDDRCQTVELEKDGTTHQKSIKNEHNITINDEGNCLIQKSETEINSDREVAAGNSVDNPCYMLKPSKECEDAINKLETSNLNDNDTSNVIIPNHCKESIENVKLKYHSPSQNQVPPSVHDKCEIINGITNDAVKIKDTECDEADEKSHGEACEQVEVKAVNNELRPLEKFKNTTKVNCHHITYINETNCSVNVLNNIDEETIVERSNSAKCDISITKGECENEAEGNLSKKKSAIVEGHCGNGLNAVGMVTKQVESPGTKNQDSLANKPNVRDDSTLAKEVTLNRNENCEYDISSIDSGYIKSDSEYSEAGAKIIRDEVKKLNRKAGKKNNDTVKENQMSLRSQVTAFASDTCERAKVLPVSRSLKRKQSVIEEGKSCDDSVHVESLRTKSKKRKKIEVTAEKYDEKKTKDVSKLSKSGCSSVDAIAGNKVHTNKLSELFGSDCSLSSVDDLKVDDKVGADTSKESNLSPVNFEHDTEQTSQTSDENGAYSSKLSDDETEHFRSGSSLCKFGITSSGEKNAVDFDGNTKFYTSVLDNRSHKNELTKGCVKNTETFSLSLTYNLTNDLHAFRDDSTRLSDLPGDKHLVEVDLHECMFEYVEFNEVPHQSLDSYKESRTTLPEPSSSFGGLLETKTKQYVKENDENIERKSPELFDSDCSLLSLDDLNVTEELNSYGINFDSIDMYSNRQSNNFESTLNNSTTGITSSDESSSKRTDADNSVISNCSSDSEPDGIHKELNVSSETASKKQTEMLESSNINCSDTVSQMFNINYSTAKNTGTNCTSLNQAALKPNAFEPSISRNSCTELDNSENDSYYSSEDYMGVEQRTSHTNTSVCEEISKVNNLPAGVEKPVVIPDVDNKSEAMNLSVSTEGRNLRGPNDKLEESYAKPPQRFFQTEPENSVSSIKRHKEIKKLSADDILSLLPNVGEVESYVQQDPIPKEGRFVPSLRTVVEDSMGVEQDNTCEVQTERHKVSPDNTNCRGSDEPQEILKSFSHESKEESERERQPMSKTRFKKSKRFAQENKAEIDGLGSAPKKRTCRIRTTTYKLTTPNSNNIETKKHEVTMASVHPSEEHNGQNTDTHANKLNETENYLAVQHTKKRISLVKNKLEKPDGELIKNENLIGNAKEPIVKDHIVSGSEESLLALEKRLADDLALEQSLARKRLSRRSQRNKLLVNKTSFKRPCLKTTSAIIESPRSPEPEAVCVDLPVLPKLMPLTRSALAKVDSPQSPDCDTECDVILPTIPKIMPLLKYTKMSAGRASVHFKKLLNFANDPNVVNEVVNNFVKQDTEHIAELILVEAMKDIFDKPDKNFTPPAPILTQTQRVLLVFMSKLNDLYHPDIFDSFTCHAEKRLLVETNLSFLQSITRMYLAVCKLKKNLDRMRRMICDAFYLMGDYAVPFLFTVVSTWFEVLPLECDSNDDPMAKVLIQVINSKTCTTSGYNLFPLRKLLSGYYGYPFERWNSDDVFDEIFKKYKENPSKTNEYALLILCKNHPTKWIFKQIETHIRPNVNKSDDSQLKVKLLTLVGFIASQFNPTVDCIIIKNIEIWLKTICDNDEMSVDVKESAKKSVQLLSSI